MGNVVPPLLALVIDIAVRLAIAGSAVWLGNSLVKRGDKKKQNHFDGRAARAVATAVGLLLFAVAGYWAIVSIADEVQTFRARQAAAVEVYRPWLGGWAYDRA